MLPPPTAAELEAARNSKSVRHPATAEHRESWSVVNPRGREVHYGTAEEAAGAAATGIY
jgi:hypothetical protein